MDKQEVNEFVNTMETGRKLLYKEKTYLFKGWKEGKNHVLHVFVKDEKGKILKDQSFTASTMNECKQSFLSFPMFEEGKSFREIKGDVLLVKEERVALQ